MNILIVSQHFYPDNFRINDIAAALVQEGHGVTVLTSLPDYADGRVPKNCRGLKNRKINWHGVNVVRCFSVSRRSGVLFRALNYVSFMASSTVKAFFMKEHFDAAVCYQTSPVLMANAARTAAKRQKIPFFLYCLDLWPESIKAWHVGEGNPLFKLVHLYCKSLYKSTDKMGVSSKPFIGYMNRVNNIPEDKMVYIPQHSEDMNLPKKDNTDGETVFAFGGNIGSVQNIECIVRAVSKLIDTDGFRVEIYGDGSELENCKRLSEELKTDGKIKYFGRVDRDTLWEKYENADAFLLTLKPEGIIGQTVPAKLQEYMSGARPVIASIEGAAAEIIEESGCGICVQPDDSDALAEAMKDFIENREKYLDCGRKGREYFLNNFTREKFISDFVKQLEEVRR